MRARRSVSGGRGAGGCGCASIQPGRARAGADQLDELQGAGQGRGGGVVVGAALEAVRGLGGEPEAARRAPDLRRREVGALDGDRRRRSR